MNVTGPKKHRRTFLIGSFSNSPPCKNLILCLLGAARLRRSCLLACLLAVALHHLKRTIDASCFSTGDWFVLTIIGPEAANRREEKAIPSQCCSEKQTNFTPLHSLYSKIALIWFGKSINQSCDEDYTNMDYSIDNSTPNYIRTVLYPLVIERPNTVLYYYWRYGSYPWLKWQG